ncbi:3-hydroxyacyl-CoA dehydrogenase [Iodidimonas gelatinilytica]|uniref:3-hydroxyacyl-CoA dehydrogenase n=1 Tax=Iodidimonas gelatinilytica TaxID=1236966 RepID=A0A5A7MX70_9PROT|nr:SDR family NAD(P)-dependent oxidoreductase [Iodidimonas gelatinilytica]GER00542.1 3-hydroxyacyl-CoA dehydrogenase [Iodidimonas gelatinilytica]
MTDLARQHAVVTGGGTGIGKAIAKRLADAGAAITLMARDEERLHALASELPKAQAIAVDICDEAAVATAFEQAAKRFGPVTILVNNAGIAPSAPLSKTSFEMWRKVMAVNLDGVFLCSMAALAGMKEHGFGRIINIASTAGLKGYPYVSAYVAAKHGVIGLTRAMALELARTSITVNSICPGFTDTDIVRRSVDIIMKKTGRTETEALAELAKDNPQKRLITPDEIAAQALWLCSSDAGSITGQALAIAGGEVM